MLAIRQEGAHTNNTDNIDDKHIHTSCAVNAWNNHCILCSISIGFTLPAAPYSWGLRNQLSVKNADNSSLWTTQSTCAHSKNLKADCNHFTMPTTVFTALVKRGGRVMFIRPYFTHLQCPWHTCGKLALERESSAGNSRWIPDSSASFRRELQQNLR